jgi:hypothetical protein
VSFKVNSAIRNGNRRNESVKPANPAAAVTNESAVISGLSHPYFGLRESNPWTYPIIYYPLNVVEIVLLRKHCTV